MTESKAWSERDWDRLLNHIGEGRVIPIVGEELYTIEDGAGREAPLGTAVATRLASRLGVPAPTQPERASALNEVVCAYLREEKSQEREPDLPYICSLLCDVVRELNPRPSAALRRLAAITDFRLLVTTAPEDLLEQALNLERFGGRSGTVSLAFRLRGKPEDLPALYGPGGGGPHESPTVFHLFGRLARRPDEFVLSDEDLLEFFFALQCLRREVDGGGLPNLMDSLRDNFVLSFGGALSDWLVRFLLRTVHGGRLSEKKNYDVLAVSGTRPDSELLKFLRFFSPRTMLATARAREFVTELHQRWAAKYPERVAPPQGILPHMAPAARMPKDAVFISYASEDREAAQTLKAHLDAGGLTVWFDRVQLQSGQNWELEIRENLQRCLFFVPVISGTTERLRQNVFFRREWHWAEQVATANDARLEFIFPVLIEELGAEPRAVPEAFSRRQSTRAPSGVPPPGFVERLAQLAAERRANPARRPSV